MSEQQHEQVIESRSSSSLGEMLRQAREKKKYTIAEVAVQLRLPRDIVVALENQQWDMLKGRTYARGYFASYVKFLGLPHDEMLAVFNLEYSASEPALNLYQYGHNGNQKSFPWALLIFSVLVLVIGWFGYQQWKQTQTLAQTDFSTEQAKTNDGFLDSIVEPLQSEEFVDEAIPTEAQSVTDDSEYDMTDSIGLTKDNVSDMNAIEDPSVYDDVTQDTEQLQNPISDETLTDSNSTLRLSFSGECWVEVSNANSQVLVSKVMRAQDSLELSSKQPLTLLLGRAEAATVFFNNKPVDLTPYTQGDVARLTLGTES